MQSSNNDSNPSAQMILSYVISLNLIKDPNITSPRVKHIEPCSKMHMFRNTKISAERHLKTNCLNSDVIQARVSSGLELAADVTSLHSSRRTFGAPRSLSARHLRKDNLITKDRSVAPRDRCRSVDSRFSRIRKTASQDKSIHRTTAEPSRSFPKNIPWVPNSLKICDNQKKDLFLNSCSTDGDNVHTIKAHSEPLITTHRSEQMKSTILKSSSKMNKESVVAGVEIITRMTLKNASTTIPSSSSKMNVIKNCTESSGNIANRNNLLKENENSEVKFQEKNENQLCLSNSPNIIKRHEESRTSFPVVLDVNDDVKVFVPLIVNDRSLPIENEKQNVKIQNTFQNINQNSNQNLINNKKLIKSIERDTKERSQNNTTERSLKNMIKECNKSNKSNLIVIDDKTDTAGNRVSILQKERIDDKNKMRTKSNCKSRRINNSCQEYFERHSEEHSDEHSDSAVEPTDHSTGTYFVLRVKILSRRNLTSNNDNSNGNNGSSSSGSSSCSSSSNNNNNDSNNNNSSSGDVKHGNSNRNISSAALIIDEGEICHQTGLFIATRGLTRRAILRSLSTQLSLVLSDERDGGTMKLLSSSSSSPPPPPLSSSSSSSSSASSASPSPVPSVLPRNVYPHITISHSLKLQHALQSISHTVDNITHNTHGTYNKQSHLTKSKVHTITKNQDNPVLTHETTQSDSVVVCISEETLDYIPLIDDTSEIVISYL